MASHGEAPAAGTSFEEGNRLAAQGDLEAAESAYARADEQGHPTAATYVGLFAQGRGEIGAARDAYRRADERGDGTGALRLGLLLAREGDWDAAKAAFARADERGREEPPFDTAGVLGYAPHETEEVVGGHRSAFANPVMVGAVTVLVAIVAVFLAYSAN